MQTTTASPRQGFTDAQVRDTLAYPKGGMIRWGVQVLDKTGAEKVSITYVVDTAAEWNSGTFYGTSVAGNTLTRT